MQKKILVEIIESGNGYSAHAPDYPGCVAAGKTLSETRGLMLAALEQHIESMLKDGEDVPGDCEYCEIMAVNVLERVHA